MKTSSDPRHQKRRQILRSLFSYSFYKDQSLDSVAAQVVKKFPRIDEEVGSSAPEWPLQRINKIDLAILRLAIYELLIKKAEPPKVIIDEAVELAKEFGSENSASFVNGALGNIYDKYFGEKNE